MSRHLSAAAVLVYLLGCAPASSVELPSARTLVKACSPVGVACDEKQKCCDGSSCQDGVCACVDKVGAACDGLRPTCCTGMTCDANGSCQNTCTAPPSSCKPLFETCSSSSECCGGASCHEGSCQVITTPLCSSLYAACETSADCCGDATLGTKPGCIETSAGRVCYFGLLDAVCGDGLPCDPGLQCVAGQCRARGAPPECTLDSPGCAKGSRCNPSDQNNFGYDPCVYSRNGNSLAQRGGTLACHGGACSNPRLYESCTGVCDPSPGTNQPTECVLAGDTPRCLQTCTTHSDCPQAFSLRETYGEPLETTAVTGAFNGPPLTVWCVPHPEVGKSFCQPRVCYDDSAADSAGPNALYRPCPGEPNSICLPYSALALSSIFGSSGANSLGYCQAVRAVGAGTSTVGLACDYRAGVGTPAALCGPDATCVGGQCLKTCDVNGSVGPSCKPNERCVSPLVEADPVAPYQAGVCGAPCDPTQAPENTGCETWCGGPRSRCQVLGSDRVRLEGRCEPMVAAPSANGAACTTNAQCQSGSICSRTGSISTPGRCAKVCHLRTPNACPRGSFCRPSYSGAQFLGLCQ